MEVVERSTASRSLAVVVVACGMVASAAGIAIAARAALEALASARIQAGPDVAAVVVATGAIDGSSQQVTLRYEDLGGGEHHVDVDLRLGRAPSILAGTGTAVSYDPSSPESAELRGIPDRRWQDVAVRLGATSMLTGAWMLLTLFLRHGRERLAASRRSHRDDPAPVPQHPVAEPDRGGRVRIAASCAMILMALGQLSLGAAIRTRTAPMAFAPSPPPDSVDSARRLVLPPLLTAPLSGRPLVSLDHARAVVEAVWPMRDEALATRDASALRAVETGPALEVDLASMRNGFPPNRGGDFVGRFDDLRVVVARQDEWPLSFMAQVITTSAEHPFLEVMIFVREQPSEPWKVVFDTGISGNEHYTPQLMPALVDENGHNVAPPLHWTDPVAVAHDLAAYWQSWVERGRPPTGGVPFAPGTWTSEYGAQIADRQDQTRDNGLVGFDDRDVPGPEEVWTFGLYDKVAACFPLRERITWLDGHQDEHRNRWGPDLEPGTYQAVTAHKVRQVCTFIPTDPGPVGVWGADDTTVLLTGERTNR